jgi:hypothetical protein
MENLISAMSAYAYLLGGLVVGCIIVVYREYKNS